MYLREMAAVFHQMIEKHLTTTVKDCFGLLYTVSARQIWFLLQSVLQTGLRDGKLHCAHYFLHLYLICKTILSASTVIVQ